MVRGTADTCTILIYSDALKVLGVKYFVAKAADFVHTDAQVPRVCFLGILST